MDETVNNVDLRDVLERDGVVVTMTVGYSMYPMLKQTRDSVVIKKLTEKPKENDVVLFRCPSGKYLLHRVIKVKKNSYTIRGDNNIQHEYGIKDSQIIGILDSFFRKDKHIDCKNNKGYKLYVQLNRRTYYIRVIFLWLHKQAAKLKHLILK